MSLGRRSIAEMVGTLLVIMGVTDKQHAPAGFGPLAIGLALTLIHLISIPVTNTSVNPARGTGVALRDQLLDVNVALASLKAKREVQSC